MDTMLFFIGIVLPYLSIAVFFGGLGYRVFRWLLLPVPIRFPLTPAPITKLGVASRLSLELLVFRSLSKGSVKLWLGGWIFHLMLCVTFLTHFINIFYHDLWAVIGYEWYDIAGYSGIVFAGAAVFLLLRRLALPSLRFFSKGSDYIILSLLILLIVMGNYLRTYGGVDLKEVSSYLYSLVALNPTLPPDNMFFLTHFLLGQLLLIYIPFSKISHLIGWVLMPTRNMRNIGRMKRHINPWNEEVKAEIKSWEEYYEMFKDQLEAVESSEGEKTK